MCSVFLIISHHCDLRTDAWRGAAVMSRRVDPICCRCVLVLLATLLLICPRTEANRVINHTLQEEQEIGSRILDLKEAVSSFTKFSDDIGFKLLEQKVDYSKVGSRQPTRSRDERWVSISDTGLVIQSGHIDREAMCGDAVECYLAVKVMQLPQQTHLNFYDLRLHIEDVNDNSPSFPLAVVDVDVSESQPAGHVIPLDQYSAQDLDIGNNSEITYTLQQTDSPFSLESGTDPAFLRLVLRDQLDFEDTRVHYLTIEACDHGTPPRANSVTIRVHVVDENDHAPVFERARYNVTIRENQAPGQALIRVRASDQDGGKKGTIKYALDGQEGRCYWPVRINQVTGMLTLCRMPDHRRDNGLRILVTATDGDEARPKTASTLLVLNVEDVNDNAPVISINYIVESDADTAYIEESEEVGAYIAHVTATDADQGKNGQVDYTVETNLDTGDESFPALTEAGKFVMTDVDGEGGFLTTAVRLDRETRSSYDVTIRACDRGKPTKCTSRTITVVVLDVNEFRPSFNHSDLVFELREDTQVGSLITTAHADDRDSLNTPALRLVDHTVERSTNGEVTYGLQLTQVDKTNDSSPLVIDHRSGKINLVEKLDYESRKKWTFLITAQDGGRPKARRATCRLTIKVGDVNDNEPVFEIPPRNNTIVRATTLQPHSDPFITLKAHDYDAVASSLRFSYRVLAKNGRRATSYHQLSDRFDLDATSGEFRLSDDATTGEALGGATGRYKLLVQVTDGGLPSLEASTIMYVDVSDQPLPLDLPEFGVYEETRGGEGLLGLDTVPLIACVLGGVVVLVLLLLVVPCLVLRHKRRSRAMRENSEAKKLESANQAPASGSRTATLTSSTNGFSGGGDGGSTSPVPSHADTVVNSRSDYNGDTDEKSKRPLLLPDSSGKEGVYNVRANTRSVSPPSGHHHPRYVELSPRKASAQYSHSPQTTHWPHSMPGSPDATARYRAPPDLKFIYPLTYGALDRGVVPPPPPKSATGADTYDPSMGERCTQLCAMYGHSDTCWMPSPAGSEVAPTMQRTTSSGGDRTIVPLAKTGRKDSGCSVDTSSSSTCSYYKMAKSDGAGAKAATKKLSLPDVVTGKDKQAAPGSDSASLMSSTTSSQGSSGGGGGGSGVRIPVTPPEKNRARAKSTTRELKDPVTTPLVVNSLSTAC